MSFDRNALIQACRTHGIVSRVVVARLRGSGPREVGASMLVTHNGSSGTIGGGTLEHQATKTARDMCIPGTRKLTTHALGPDLGQCCGGSVDLLTEVFDLDLALSLPEDIVVRGDGEVPLAVARLKAKARNSGDLQAPQLISGWMVEPVSTPTRDIWIWGAGHVGRALVDVLTPIPTFKLTWIDKDRGRFPDAIADQIDVLFADRPEALVAYAPITAEHLIVTFSHDLDLELCHRLLGHGSGFTGLIGSATKWARFRTRLKALGHSHSSISQITCPIGQPELGKHPHAIALGVGAKLLSPRIHSNQLEGTA